MKRTIRTAVAAALTAAVAFGVTVPAATAAPKDKPAKVATQGAKGKATAGTKKVAGQDRKAAAAERRTAAQQRQVLRDLDRRDARLAAVVAGDRLAGLPEDAVTAISTNVENDRTGLAAIRTAVEGGGQDLRQVRAELRTYRVETYNMVVGIVRGATEVAEQVALNDAALAELPAEDPAVVEAKENNAAALVAAELAAEDALLLTATSPVADRQSPAAGLESAVVLLELVAAFLAENAAGTPDQQA
jgi:hypothetical protein